MITGISSNLTVLGTILGFESAIVLPTTELISIGNRFSSTPFSTCTTDLVGSSATSFRSDSLLLDSDFFLDHVLLTLLSGWFLVELHVATLLTMLSPSVRAISPRNVIFPDSQFRLSDRN
jgi:hypothetical protein